MNNKRLLAIKVYGYSLFLLGLVRLILTPRLLERYNGYERERENISFERLGVPQLPTYPLRK